ncbi:MAG: alkaline phosphatase family protein [Acidimicrobiales bacterium]
MAELVLGPMLRHVDETSATVWVETDGPCRVSVHGPTAAAATTHTFCVGGHHYALVMVENLHPGTVIPYQVQLDDTVVWPPEQDPFPPCVIRTLGHGGPLRVIFGSCRAAAPHEPPYSLEIASNPEARGVDALRAHGLRMLRQTPSEWPDLLMLVGDQVYADDVSPGVRRQLAGTTRPMGLPQDSVANFEEYTWLYREAWTPDVERWLFSVVPSAMIFDDHDMIDDWNISEAWVRDTRREPWWQDHIIGGLVSYWIYQHLGNLSPQQVRAEGILQEALNTTDAEPVLRRWAEQSEAFTPVPGGYRFSYVRDLGPVRLVVVDSRNGRVLRPGARAMVDADEWDWVVKQCQVPCRDLLIASSLPVLVPGGLHDLQVWSERLCDGKWGRWAAKVGERLRRALDLEDWAAFANSFATFMQLLSELGRGAYGPAPRTISILSGDIHFSYRAELHFPSEAGVTSHINQLVSSPMRNALAGRDRKVLAFGASSAGRAIGRVLRRSVGARAGDMQWKLTEGPFFANEMSLLTLDDDTAEYRIEQASPDEDGRPTLSIIAQVDLAPTGR